MSVVYDSNYHLHLGYYEDKFDFESVAYKRESEDVWDVFFDSNLYGIDNNLLNFDKLNYTENLGYKIFTIHTNDLSYEDGSEKFKEWLLENKLI